VKKNKIAIVTPVFNDNESLKFLLNEIDQLEISSKYGINVFVVNDCSDEQFSLDRDYQNISLCLINLDRNLGHQRAIAIGLYHISKLAFYRIIVMDSDGEDSPSYISKMLERMENGSDILVAKRSKRSEGIIFKFFYKLYKLFFRLLTGYQITFGNFSVMTNSALLRLIKFPELSNNYAGTILKSKLSIDYINTNRGERYKGKSKMSFTNLLLHGFSAISVFYEYLIIRSIVAFTIMLTLAFTILIIVLFLRFILDIFIFPGWATALSGILSIIIIQILVFLMMIAFFFLNGRSNFDIFNSQKKIKHINSIEEYKRGKK